MKKNQIYRNSKGDYALITGYDSESNLEIHFNNGAIIRLDQYQESSKKSIIDSFLAEYSIVVNNN